MRIFSTRTFVASAAVAILSITATAQAQITPQTLYNVTLTAVAEVDYGGEEVSLNISQGILPGCPVATAYIIRDANIIKGGLAVAMAAFLAGRQVDLYVTGSCDIGGNPLIASVNVH
jgi:hypothetical protein